MITPAPRMNSAVMAPRAATTMSSSVEASFSASARRSSSSSSVKTGTKAAESAASANRPRTRFGTWKARVNADIGPVMPK